MARTLDCKYRYIKRGNNLQVRLHLNLTYLAVEIDCLDQPTSSSNTPNPTSNNASSKNRRNQRPAITRRAAHASRRSPDSNVASLQSTSQRSIPGTP